MNAPAVEQGLERFGAEALDYAAVRALLERLALTPLGLRALRELEPRSDEEASRALARVEELLDLEARGLRPSFAGISDPLPALHAARAYHRALSQEELAALTAFLEGLERLALWLLERAGEHPELARLGAGAPLARKLAEELARTLDARGRLREDASPLLARLRAEERRMSERIQELLEGLLASAALRPFLSDLAIHRRGGRRCLALRARSAGRLQGLVHQRSHSGETVFVEPRETLELGNRLAEVEHDARSEEQRILAELTRAVLACEDELAEAARRLAELELGHVGALFCREFQARVPRLSKPGQGLLLRSARHPLLVEEQRRGALAEVVPIDVRLGEEFDLLVITGPNTGGKTLALKTVGLAGLLVRLGMPVCCAEGSRVPLYDRIAADIGDRQEIRQSLSTFASHLVRIRAGLEQATPRSLLLLDELGGGTDPDEGAALGDALLEHLLARGVPTLVSTHIGKLKEFAFRNPRAENASVAFDATTLRPRYTLMIGTPGESNALHIAAHLGLDPDLVARARARLERRDREVQALMEDVRGAREHAERLRSAAETSLEQAARTRADADAAGADLKRRSDLLEAESQRVLDERLSGARGALARARLLLAQLPTAQAEALGAVLAQVEASLRDAALTERRKAFLDGLQKGQFVWVHKLMRRALVTRVDRERGEVLVRVGGMGVRVGFDDLSSPQ